MSNKEKADRLLRAYATAKYQDALILRRGASQAVSQLHRFIVGLTSDDKKLMAEHVWASARRARSPNVKPHKELFAMQVSEDLGEWPGAETGGDL